MRTKSNPVGLVLVAICIVFTRFSQADEPNMDVLVRLKRFVPPLKNDRGDRLPILIWETPDLPTGRGADDVSEIQSVYVDRGLTPLCNSCGIPKTAKGYLPILQYWKSRGIPICILPQGWLQAPFANRDGKATLLHQAPAKQAEELPCTAGMHDITRTSKHGADVVEVLQLLKDAEIPLKVLLIDFEAGLYLRNDDETKAKVDIAFREACKCPRCIAEYGANLPKNLQDYAFDADKVRAAATQKLLADPARSVFPNVSIGNYFTWPVNRLPPPKDHFPAYGFEESGLNIMMPRMYITAGWGGADKSQERVNRNTLYYCLAEFSPPASVRKPDELLIPWVHVYLGGRYLKFVNEGRAIPEPWVMGEVTRHMILRGMETVAIYHEGNEESLPANYPYAKYADMGQVTFDVQGIQQAYDEMLVYNDFLRQATPMTFDVTGKPNQLDASSDTWSGMQTDEKALVRTISFDRQTHRKAIRAFGKSFSVSFSPEGRSWWLFPNGKVEEVIRKREI